jgi:hypothetical protein
MPVLKGAAAGASIGTSILPGIGTAVGAAIGAVGGLLVGKKHYSPWGFLYDDYPKRIYANEVEIVNLKNAISALQGGPQLPKPPDPLAGGFDKTRFIAAMLQIVPQYAPGSESQIKSFDRRGNEPGGSNEIAYGAQISLIPQLQQQLASLQTAAAIRGNVPSPGSATQPVQLQLQPPAPMSPATVQIPTAPQTQAYPYTAPPSSATDYVPAIRPQEAGMLPSFDTNSAAPYVIGGLALLFLIASNFDKKGR